MDGYKEDDQDMGGEVEYLSVSKPTRVCLSQSSRLPGTEVGKITGFDSGLHFNLPGFRLQLFNSKPWPRLCPGSRTFQRLSISSRQPKSPWRIGYSATRLIPVLGNVLAYERFGSQVTWQVAS
jgi:hypothetical protein